MKSIFKKVTHLGSARKFIFSSVLITLVAVGGYLVLGNAPHASAATANGCTVASGDGTESFDAANTTAGQPPVSIPNGNPLSISAANTYYLWLRMLSPDGTNDSLGVSIDGGACITMGATMPANTWTWVDTQIGSSTPESLPLTAGNHTMVITGGSGMELDSFQFLSVPPSSCTPNNPAGFNATTNPTPYPGQNCILLANEVAPSVSLSSPTDNATYTTGASVPISGSASDSIAVTQVAVSVNNGTTTSTIYTDTSNPISTFSTNWTPTTAGTYTISAVATDTGGLTKTSAPITVTVTNPSCTGTPTAPSNLADTDGTPKPAGKVDLSWTAVTPPANCALAGYNIYRSTGGGTQTKLNASPITTGTTYSDSTVAATTAYDYQVTAVDTSGTTPESAKAPASPGLAVTTGSNCSLGSGKPTTPTLSAGTPSYTSIPLSWTASTDSDGCNLSGYNVYRGSTLLNSTLLPTTQLTLTDTGQGLTPANLIQDTTYQYTVVAVDSGGNDATSAVVPATTEKDNLPPTTPSGLTAAAANPTLVNLSWNATTDNPNPGGVGVAGYNIYRCTGTNCVPTTLIGTTSTATTYGDSSVSGSTTYNYGVAAFDKNNNLSSISTAVPVTTPAAPPSCTGNPSPAPVLTQNNATTTVTAIGLTWTASTPASGCTLSGYQVWRNNVNVTTTSATTTSYVDSALTPGTYSYYIVAIDTSSHKATSATESFATAQDTTPPTTPTNFTAANSGGAIVLTWTASTDTVGVSDYVITRTNTGGTTQTFTVTGGSSTSYTDSNSIAASTTYNYSIKAVDTVGNVSSAATTSITTPAPACTGNPTAPGKPTTSAITTSGVTLTWAASTPASGCTISGYKILNGTTVVSGSSLVGGLTDSINGLTPNTSYTLTVEAFDSSSHVSPASPSVTFTTSPASTTPVPGDINGDGQVNTQDFTILLIHWGNGTAIPAYTNGDPSFDVQVNTAVFTRFLIDWGNFLA